MKKNGVYQGIKNSMINMAGNMIRKMSLATGAVLATVAAAGLAMALSGTDIVYADDVSGVDGGIKWTISGNGNTKTLTIEPAGGSATNNMTSGVMKDYTSFPTDSGGVKTPWAQKVEYNDVKKIIVEKGVTSIGDKAFGNSKTARKKEFESVVIKSDVEEIGQYAFCNSTINNIEFYGLGLLSGKIDPTAFVSSDEDSNLHINIGNLSCYKKTGEVYEYFSKFNAGDITFENGNKTVKQSNININYYNVVVSSTNLLGTDDKVYAQFTGADEIEADTNGSNVPSDDVLRAFYNSESYNDLSKLKLFNITMSDSNAAVKEATLKVPVPSTWSETSKIKLLAYNGNGGENPISEVSGTTFGTIDDKKYISFTTNDYRTYALYYDYNENPQTEISITTDFFQGVFQWNINNGSATLATPISAAATDAFNAFKNTYDSNYKLDAVHLRAFDISATVDGNSVGEVLNLKVTVPVPSEWESNARNVKVLTITNSQIKEVEGVVVKTVDGKAYLEFTPPHFSPYALYYANAGETPPTQPTTSAQQPTTSNGNGNNNNSTTSYTQATTKAPGGSLDNTPNTGVKDVMWILIPAATLLLGVGIVVLARRKKNINDNY